MVIGATSTRTVGVQPATDSAMQAVNTAAAGAIKALASGPVLVIDKLCTMSILCTSSRRRHGGAGTEIGREKLVQVQRCVQRQVYRRAFGQRQWLVEGASAQKVQDRNARLHRLGRIMPSFYVQQHAQPPHRQTVDLAAELIEGKVLERLIGEILHRA